MKVAQRDRQVHRRVQGAFQAGHRLHLRKEHCFLRSDVATANTAQVYLWHGQQRQTDVKELKKYDIILTSCPSPCCHRR